VRTSLATILACVALACAGCSHEGDMIGRTDAVIARGSRMSAGPSVDVTRGRYLVRAGDCQACHTAAGGKPFAGGRAVPTPFGTIYSTNITPDPDTGIGDWSDADFYRAMHAGIRRDGKHLYPAFPYPWFTKLDVDDVRAIRAYLATLPPVRQLNRPNALPWPLSVRSAMAVWNSRYFDAGGYRDDPMRSAQWNRGAYLVQGLGHCSACHGDKNFAGAVDKKHPLTGGFAEHVYAPSLGGGLRDGLGGWSVQDIVDYLGDGRNAKSAATGPMAEVVADSTQYLTEADRRAMAVYLKSLPARQNDSVDAADADLMKQGHALYTDNCEGCHLRAGTGEAGAFPPLQGSAAIQAAEPDSLIAVILHGARAPATRADASALAMPAFADKLDNAEVAALISYIRQAWGNRASAVSADKVSDLRKTLRQSP